MAAFLRRWPGSRAVELRGGWQAIPVDDGLYAAIEAAAPGATRPPELDMAPFGLDQALAAATETGGGLAYIETEYFGGTGGQSAMAFVDDQEVMAPQRSRGGGGPINQALRAIGVKRDGDTDEFDVVGLGERRSMTDYEPEGPMRLRGGAPSVSEAKPTARDGYFPMWLVILVMAAAIGGGVMLAVVK